MFNSSCQAKESDHFLPSDNVTVESKFENEASLIRMGVVDLLWGILSTNVSLIPNSETQTLSSLSLSLESLSVSLESLLLHTHRRLVALLVSSPAPRGLPWAPPRRRQKQLVGSSSLVVFWFQVLAVASRRGLWTVVGSSLASSLILFWGWVLFVTESPLNFVADNTADVVSLRTPLYSARPRLFLPRLTVLHRAAPPVLTSLSSTVPQWARPSSCSPPPAAAQLPQHRRAALSSKACSPPQLPDGLLPACHRACDPARHNARPPTW
ncbi:hypothetical protein S83_062386 [Arachis hypogaea]